MNGALRARTEVVARTGRLDEEDVRQLALQLKAVMREGVDSFGSLAETWLTRIGQRRVEPKNEQRHVRHLAALHGLREGELTVSRLEQHFTELALRLKPQTLNKLRSTGRLIIRTAQADGKWNGPNPFEVMRRWKETKRVYAKMTPLELARTLACIRKDRRALARVAFYTGMRPGELLGLRKVDVHLEDRRIDVRRSHQRDQTKTGRERWVPIPEAIVADLRQALDSSASQLVFPGRGGKPMRADTKLTRFFRVALVEAGVVDGYAFKCRQCGAEEHHEDGAQRWCECGAKMWVTGIPRPLRFYDLRHLCSTLNKQAGANAHVVKMVLGHAASDVNEDVYTHFSEEYVKQQMNLLALPSCIGVGTVTMSAATQGGVAVNAEAGQASRDQERRMGFEPTTPSLGSQLVHARPEASAGELLTVKEVAEMLRLKCSDTVYRWISLGRIRVVRIGSLIRVPREELQGFLARPRFNAKQ